MAGSAASASNMSVLLQTQRPPLSASSQPPLDAFFLSSSSPSFLGSRSIVSFEDVNQVSGSTRPFFRTFGHDDNGDDDLDDYFHQPEKKRRLTVDQVQFLEKSFEVENKLEPERKVQLAKDLGLQPRQVAIWFQNRRARWKTKQLEKDYETLQAGFDKLKADYDSLLKEKDKLKTEVNLLTDKLLHKEKDKGSSELSDKDSEPPKNSVTESASDGEVSKLSTVACKQEDISSAKSDIFESDSPHYTDGVHSSLIETGDSSYAFEPDQSDLSQDEEDNLSRNLLPPYVFPKLEDSDYSEPPASFEDHPFWSSWPLLSET